MTRGFIIALHQVKESYNTVTRCNFEQDFLDRDSFPVKFRATCGLQPARGY